MSAALVWVNGRPATGDAHVSALDRGFTLADGLFETLRVYDGRPFRLDSHFARMARGAGVLGISMPAGELRETVAAALRDAADAGWRDAALRLTVTRGAGIVGVAPPPAAHAPRPTSVVTVQPVPLFPPAIYERGLSARVASGVRNERAMTAGLKTLGYTDAVLALAEARRAGADEAIFLDTEGHCSEATSSNLFAVVGDTLVTPPVSCGALPGITRAAVMELARGLEIEVAERVLTLDELTGAREAFLTSSLRELAPLVRVNDQAIGHGVPGSTTRELTRAYEQLVRGEGA
jgi:branched-chain amino acid aminotransferase